MFKSILGGISPVYSNIVERQHEALGQVWLEEFMEDMTLLFGPSDQGKSWEDACWGYVEFCLDASKSQHYFEKNGRYKASSFAEVQQSNYDNKDFMWNNYLPGMVVSHYLWPHHYNMGHVYRTKYMPLVEKKVNPKTFVEGGTGSAMYTLHTLRSLKNVHGYAYDISSMNSSSQTWPRASC